MNTWKGIMITQMTQKNRAQNWDDNDKFQMSNDKGISNV